MTVLAHFLAVSKYSYVCSAAPYAGLQAPAAGPAAGRERLTQRRQHHALERSHIWT